MNNFKTMLLISIIVALGSQVHLNYKIPGFIITLAVILLVILMYIFEVNYYKTIFITAIVSPFFRGVIYFISSNSLQETLIAVSPDVIFYLTFGLIFFFLHKYSRENLTYFIIIVFFADIFSNIMEISFRVSTGGSLDYEIINFLFIVALIRSVVILVSLILYKSYRSFLKSEEHERRYRKLLLLQSFFKSEIYFMNKNIEAIEDIMKDSYKLHKISKDQESSELSLKIARNIHEVKKDYIRVIDGLNEISGKEKGHKKSLTLKDMIEILSINTKEYIEKNDLNIELKTDCQVDHLRTDKHYHIMSVLRNLLNNAIEAISNYGRIEIRAFRRDKNLIITVEDDGKGIKDKNIDYIFNLGYSTKFKDGDGKSRRGMGLSLVKILVEDKLNGKINLMSETNEGTTFELILPVDSL